jgi:hypothetical protein
MTSTRGERLRKARERRFKSARAAASALGIPPATYGAHERAEAPGGRGRDYGAEEAVLYGARFQVRPEWLLAGAEPETEAEYNALLDRLAKVGLDQPGPGEKVEKLAAALNRNTLAIEKLHWLLERLIMTTPEEDHRKAASGAQILTELGGEIAEIKAASATERAAREGEREGPSMEEIVTQMRRLLAVDPPSRQKPVLEVVAERRSDNAESSSSQRRRKRRRAR